MKCWTACALAGALASVAIARADIPSPQASYVDPCIVTCPAGDSVFVVIARKADGRPFTYGTTVIHLCGCPDVVLAPVESGGLYQISGCTASASTWPQGVSAFPLASGGLCSGASITVHCDGLLMGTRTSVASFDQDGDLVVTTGDLSQVSAKQGNADPTADFNCDGQVGAADLDLATAHLGHFHGSIVGVGRQPDLELAVLPVPNPSRGPLSFLLHAPAAGRAILTIYDTAGRRVAVVVDRELEAGMHRVPWSGRDASGREVPTGLYRFRLILGGNTARGALVLAR